MTELETKTKRLVNLIENEELGGVLINAQHNFAWLTCGGSNGVDLSRDNGVASLFVDRNGKRYILANNIEMHRMLAEEIPAPDFAPVEFSWQDEKTAGFAVKELIELAGGRKIGTDIVYGDGAVVMESKIAECRYQLTSEEIDRYRTLGHDAGIALRTLIDKLSPGETEIEIAEKLRHELAQNEMTSVVTLVAADERISQFRHPIPTKNEWQKTLMLVTCAKRGGLIVNLTRMVNIGPAPTELKERTGAAAFVNARLWAATVAGAMYSDLYFVAADAYDEAGFGDEIDLHHQGGATGYRTRDWVAHPLGKDVVQPNQAFAWNPSITGTKVEDTCILIDDQTEMISASPDFPDIVTNVNGRDYRSCGVLQV